MSRKSMFYITTGNMEEAEKLARLMVERRLAACVNVVPGMRSFFYWEGEVQQEEEVLLLGKTREELVEELVRLVKENHSYHLPCTVTWNMDGGNQAFLDWIEIETS